MTITEAIIVGAVQGLAEFLPISSSGHIVLTEFLLGMRELGSAPPENIAFEVVLHMGTLLSVIVFFRLPLIRLIQSLYTKKLVDERKKILWLMIASVPAAAAYVVFKDHFKAAYGNPVLVSALLIVTGLLLFVPGWIKRVKEGGKEIGLWTALLMGVFQAFAILPGISRSGSTIIAGLAMNAKPEKVAEFSFLMSIPAIGGGFLFALKDIMKGDSTKGIEGALAECCQPSYLAGAGTAAVVGFLAIYLVMGAVKKGKLTYFSYYCFLAGISGIVYFTYAV